MKILLVIDYSAASKRAVADFAGRTWPPGTSVRVLAVVVNHPPSAAELWFDAEGSLEMVLQGRRERAGELAGGVAGMLIQKGLTAEAVVRTGRRRKVIAQEAQSWAADEVIDVSRDMRGIRKGWGEAS